MAELTQDRLKAVLLYDPEIGVWTWRHRSDRTNAVAAYAAYLDDVGTYGTEFHRVDIQIAGANQ